MDMPTVPPRHIIPDTLRVPDRAVRTNGLPPAPIPGAKTARHMTVSPTKVRRGFEEEFKEQELARMPCCGICEPAARRTTCSHGRAWPCV